MISSTTPLATSDFKNLIHVGRQVCALHWCNFCIGLHNILVLLGLLHHDSIARFMSMLSFFRIPLAILTANSVLQLHVIWGTGGINPSAGQNVHAVGLIVSNKFFRYAITSKVNFCALYNGLTKCVITILK